MPEARSLQVIRDDAGLYVPGLDLHLDPRRPVRRAFVSHAHADHAAGLASGTVLASRETLALLEARARTTAAGGQIIPWEGALDLPLPGGSTARLAIAPAGHILGAAQLVADLPDGRLVYTGDYRTGAGRTHATGAPVACDALVLESTFALPIFRFPDRVRTLEAIVAFCREALAAAETPVLLAYALGKSQELAAYLAAAGIAVIAHGAAFRLGEVYERLGVPCGIAEGAVTSYAAFAKEGSARKGKRAPAPTAALLLPPQDGPRMLQARSNGEAELRTLARRARVAFISGWALLDAQLEQRRADAGFVLSDHADHDDLVATARASGARHVTTTFGDATALAKVLARRGIAATPLEAEALDVHPSAPAEETA